jgi:hypothetical protein
VEALMDRPIIINVNVNIAVQTIPQLLAVLKALEDRYALTGDTSDIGFALEATSSSPSN